MDKQEKQLLLADLCARLPYGVKVHIKGEYHEYHEVEEIDISNKCVRYFENLHLYEKKITNCLPYLRPMESMTKEEREELRQEHIKDEKLFAECIRKAANGDSSMRGKVVPHFAADWCNKNHFDYRGLILMGLALEATEGMYK